MTTQACSQITDLNQVIIVRRSSERRGRERVIGTFLERLEVLKAAEDVLLRMEKSGISMMLTSNRFAQPS